MNKFTKAFATVAGVAALSLAINSPAFAVEGTPFTIEFVTHAEGHDAKMNIHQTGNVTISDVGSKIIFTAPKDGFPTNPMSVDVVVDGVKACQYGLLCTRAYEKDGHLMQNCGLQKLTYGESAAKVMLGTIDYGTRTGCTLDIAISKGERNDFTCTGTITKR